ncbi:MAG TPA: DUF3261 domain-containing protein [Dongiaceae bacterium]
MKPFAAGLLLLALLTGCVSPATDRNAASQETAALLAPNLRLDLPDPASMGQSVEVVQLVSAHHGGHTVVFEAHLSIRPERVLLVGVDPTGQRLMTVTWRGSEIAIDASPFLPKEVRPGAMLADLVALYWPEDVVRHALASSGASLSVEATGRVVSFHGKPVLEAVYDKGSADPWNGGLHYRNLSWGYNIDVETLQVNR